MKKQVTKKKRNQKLKKKLASMTAIVLVLAVGVWGTMAYLSTLTDKKTNTFTGSSGIKLEVEEKNWTTTGEKKANSYTPNMSIEKDPKLKNTNNDGGKSEYVAMRIDFLDASNSSSKTAITYAQLLNVIKLINYKHSDWTLAAVKNTSGWTDKKSDNTDIDNDCLYSTGAGAYVTLDSMDDNIKNATSMIFLYTGNSGRVSAQSGTSALFDTIQIRNGYTSVVTDGTDTIAAEPIYAFTDASQTTPLDGSTETGKGFPKFQIDVLGAAVEADGSDGDGTIDSLDKAKTGLLNLLENN